MDFYSIIAGFLACLASVIGKYALDSNSEIILYISNYCNTNFKDEKIYNYDACYISEMLSRLILFLLMIFVNLVMLTYFLRSLHTSDSIRATIINTASNFLFSGLLGYLLFHENLNKYWFIGASFIIIGILILVSIDKQIKHNVKKNQIKNK